MKKIFLFLALAIVVFSINSCSSDSKSDKATGTISFKVNGVQKTFNSIHFSEKTYLEGTADEYVGVGIHTDPDNNYDSVNFSFIKGDMDHIFLFTYIKEGDMGHDPIDGFSFHITSNGDDKKLIGTFSGEMVGPTDVTITEGSFNIQY